MWEAVRQANRSSTRLYALVRNGVSLYLGGNWTEAGQTFEEGRKLAEQLGDTRNLGLLSASDASCRFLQGKFHESLHIWIETYQRAVKQDNPQELAWGLYGQGHNLLMLGKTDEAVRLLEASIAIPMKNADDKILNASRYGALSLAYFRKGEFDKALETILQHQRLAPSTPSLANTVRDYEGVFEAIIGLWKTMKTGQYAPNPMDAERIQQAFQRIPYLAKALRTSPVNKARTFLYEGIYNDLTRRVKHAQLNWRTCIALAEEFQQPYELGRAHYELGVHLENPARTGHLEKAYRIFSDLQTPYELELVRMALEEPTSASGG